MKKKIYEGIEMLVIKMYNELLLEGVIDRVSIRIGSGEIGSRMQQLHEIQYI